MPNLPAFRILLASPRGFCAGVERAIRTVEMALDDRAPGDDRPIYVRHEIVHNRSVVASLHARGAIFVDDMQVIPEGATAVYSAHGVSPAVRQEAEARHLVTVDATCPLVSRVHAAVLRAAARGYTILFVGHAGHPEVQGVLGEAPHQVRLIETLDDARRVDVPDPERVAYATQTTLSLDDVAGIVRVLRARFPHLLGPEEGDVCYATQNRQEAVQALVARGADVVLVLGSANSSNSNRLAEVARTAGAREAHLIDSVRDLQADWLQGAEAVGVTAGASTPEHLVQELLTELQRVGGSSPELVQTSVEDVFFAPPPSPSARSRTGQPGTESVS